MFHKGSHTRVLAVTIKTQRIVSGLVEGEVPGGNRQEGCRSTKSRDGKAVVLMITVRLKITMFVIVVEVSMTFRKVR